MRPWLVLIILVFVACDDRAPERAGVHDIAAPPSELAPDVSSPEAPELIVLEGAEVIPQTELHLEGRWPGREEDPVVAWSWSAAQPEGSVSRFRPSADIAEPTFETNVAGTYDFNLTMTSRSGQTASMNFMVVVVPDSALHVELLWHTPSDIDEGDEGDGVGTDVDLHMLRIDRASTWFDSIFDCYFGNPQPTWTTMSTADDPTLDRDDTDGAGPENMNGAMPPSAACYRIGVHYWDDWSFGASLATVRVYLHGELAFESAETRLVMDDLWTVAEVCAVGTVVPSELCNDDGCGPAIEPAYHNRNFPMFP